ncbi:hypothetical protein [Enterobacter ludwigii]
MASLYLALLWVCFLFVSEMVWMRIPELADYPVGVREYGERHEALTLPDIFEDVFVRHASRPAFEW